jgi:hypothetical protein
MTNSLSTSAPPLTEDVVTFRLRIAPKVPNRAAKGPCRTDKPDSTLTDVTVSSSAYMGASDAFACYMERDPTLRSTVVAVVWLDRDARP